MDPADPAPPHVAPFPAGDHDRAIPGAGDHDAVIPLITMTDLGDHDGSVHSSPVASAFHPVAPSPSAFT